MLALGAHMRFFFCQQPVNLNKSFEGLGALVQELFPNELFSGAFFIFLNRRRSQMKVLVWDGDGFVIWCKRLEKGTFQWQWGQQAVIDRKRFLMLLEGIAPKRIQRRFSLQN